MYREIDEYPDLDDDRNLGFCKHCQTDTYFKKQDFGIGAYEYWGSKGIHHDWHDVCTECGEES